MRVNIVWCNRAIQYYEFSRITLLRAMGIPSHDRCSRQSCCLRPSNNITAAVSMSYYYYFLDRVSPALSLLRSGNYDLSADFNAYNIYR